MNWGGLKMTRFKVTVTQTNVFFIDKDDFDEWDFEPTAEHAKRIATEDRIWDENQSGDDTYSVSIDAEEVNDEWVLDGRVPYQIGEIE